MAVQGSERKFNICDRCFASVPATQPFCPECGAPIVTEEHHTEGSDQAVYTELARANLLRMRGEYKQAEEQCLNILKRFPNNASANTLLGDISAEQGDLTQAIQWYELSLDLLPGDEAVKMKLDAAKNRISIQEAADTAKQLGLPANPTNKNRYVAAVTALVLIVAAASYFFGSKRAASTGGKATLTSAVRAPSQTTGGDGTGDEQKLNPEDPVAGGGGELPLLRRLASTTPDGTKVLAVMEDPRDQSIIVSYLASDSDARALGARLARSLLDIEADTLNVTVRGMRGGALIYTADVLRSRMNEVDTQTWTSEHQSDPNAWIDHVLANEWSAGPIKNQTATAPTPATTDAEGKAPVDDTAKAAEDAPPKPADKTTDEAPAGDGKEDTGAPKTDPTGTTG